MANDLCLVPAPVKLRSVAWWRWPSLSLLTTHPEMLPAPWRGRHGWNEPVDAARATSSAHVQKTGDSVLTQEYFSNVDSIPCRLRSNSPGAGGPFFRGGSDDDMSVATSKQNNRFTVPAGTYKRMRKNNMNLVLYELKQQYTKFLLICIYFIIWNYYAPPPRRRH